MQVDTEVAHSISNHEEIDLQQLEQAVEATLEQQINEQAEDNVDVNGIMDDVIKEAPPAEVPNKDMSKKNTDDKAAINPTLVTEENTKKEIVAAIIKVHEDCRIPLPTTPSQLGRRKKVELMEMLGKVLSDAKVMVEQQKNEEIRREIQSKNIKKTDPIHALIVVNEALGTCLEMVGNASKGYTGDVNVLAGYGDKIKENREAMEQTLAAVYSKYSGEIDKFLNPVAQYLFMMSAIAIGTISQNVGKKKAEAPNKSE